MTSYKRKIYRQKVKTMNKAVRLLLVKCEEFIRTFLGMSSETAQAQQSRRYLPRTWNLSRSIHLLLLVLNKNVS